MSDPTHAPDDPRPAIESVVAWLALLLVLSGSASAPRAALEPECSSLSGIVLEANEPLRWGERAFEVKTVYRPESDASDAGSTRGRLELDLLARYLDPQSRTARVGSYIPHLDARYVLRGPDGVASASGSLAFRLSGWGPSYGVNLSLDLPPGTPIELDLDLVSPASPGPPEACPERGVRMAVRFVLEPSHDPEGEGAGMDAPADDIRVAVIGQSDPRTSESYSDVWGWTDGTTHLAIIGSTNGTLFMDVSDPANPTEIADIPGPSSSWRDIKTYLDHAYITTEGTGSGEGLQIVDIVDVMGDVNPILVNTYDSTFTTAHNIYIDEANALAWCVGTNNGAQLLGLSLDPASPVSVGSWSVRYVHDIWAGDGRACLAEINDGIQELADITDPGNLTVLSTWSTPGTATHNCWPNVGRTLLATTDETTGGHVAVYDISNELGPIALLGEYAPNPSASVHNVFFDDDDPERIAMSHYGLGFKYVDLHRPTAPLELGSYDTRPTTDSGFNGAWGVYPFDSRGYFYVSDIQTGLYVLQYVPTGGTLSGDVRDATDESPVPGARVVLLSNATEQFTGADGVFVTYAPEGATVVRVGKWGYATEIVDLGSMPLDGRLDVDVELTRLPVSGLSGFVRRANDSTPVADATVNIVGSTLTTQTAGDGSYSFPEVAAGQQLVTASAAGFASIDATVVMGPAVLDLILEPGVFADDAETDLGWDLGVAGDTATTGFWVRVDPVGSVGGTVQPEDDHTPAPGVTAFVTGQGSPGSGAETQDVDNGFTTLQSPIVDASALVAGQLSFARWVSEDAGPLPGGTFRAEVSGDGGSNWTTVETVATTENTWTTRSFDLGSAGALTNQARVRFVCESPSPQAQRTMECGVDDVSIVPACRAFFASGFPDDDYDGLVNACDPCPADSEDDGDGDGICGDVDNAPFTSSLDLNDADMDGVGDVADNCVSDANPAQRDLDGDTLGDACDTDLDGDGLDDGVDADRDDDGIPTAADLCPDVPDDAQIDRDLDGEGDACDPDDGEVQGVRLAGNRIVWEPEVGSDAYNLYRGDTGAAELVPLSACRVAGVSNTFYADPQLPPPGDGFLYLVTRTVAGNEATAGYGSDGIERQILSPCP